MAVKSKARRSCTSTENLATSFIPSQCTTHRKRSCSENHLRNSPFLFTPSPAPPYIAGSRYKKSSSSEVTFTITPALSRDASSDDEDYGLMDTETDEDSQQPTPPVQKKTSSWFTTSRMRNPRVKLISTSIPGEGAGETETEIDEPPKRLPTTRNVPQTAPIIPPGTLQQTFTPILFEFARLLSILPASLGVLWCFLRCIHPPDPSYFDYSSRSPPQLVDYILASFWAILTAYQALSMTSGLLHRWYLYYPPLSTLIRLVALQGICWPLTHLTLIVLDGALRPVTAWAVIGTSTCISRSVQIWVTSNLWWSKTSPNGGQPGTTGGYWKRVVGGGTWGGRRWDWREVGAKCMFPAGCLYFLMAWVGEVRREWGTS